MTQTLGYWHLEKIGTKWYFCTPVNGSNAVSHAFDAMSVSNIVVPNTTTYDAARRSVYITATNNVIFNKYGDMSTKWSTAVVQRMVNWSFNSMGQDSAAVAPSSMATILELKPAEDAATNVFSFLASPIKDNIAGSDAHFTSFLGGSLYDDFDPGLHSEWTQELAANKPGANSLRANSPTVLCLFTDDSDFFWGAGAGPDFPSGHTNTNIGFTTIISSPVQTGNVSTTFQSKAFLYSDTKNYTKTQANNTVGCSISNPCSLRDYLHDKYGTIAALNTAWGSSYTTFDSTGTQQTAEQPAGCTNSCTGNGATTVFTATLGHTPVSPLSVQVTVAGTVVVADCPWFHGHCGGGSSGTGQMFSPTANFLTQASSSINYTTGAITLTFVTAPANGAAIAFNYISGGWNAGGTGLMDENGANSWIGTNNSCLEGADTNYPTYFSCVGGGGKNNPVPNANATLGADLDAWIPEYVARYFKTMHDDLRAAPSNVPYFGLDVLGSFGTPPYSKVLQGASPYLDGAFVSLGQWWTDNTQFTARYDYLTQYMGDIPFMTFSIIGATTDSGYFSSNTSGSALPPANNIFTTQAARGNGWYNFVNFLQTTLSHNNDIQSVGNDWWSWQDIQMSNQGLVSVYDNAYDGTETASSSVACDNYYTVQAGAMCGGEVNTAAIPAWTATTSIPFATCVHPTTPNGFTYCNEPASGSAGTTGSSEPTWSSCVVVGCVVSPDDGGAHWINVAVPSTPYGNSITETQGIIAGNQIWLTGTAPTTTGPATKSIMMARIIDPAWIAEQTRYEGNKLF